MSPTANVRFELLHAGGDFSQYLIRDARELRFLLRQLAAKRALISVYPGESSRSSLTSLLDVPESGNGPLLLDVASDKKLNEALLAAPRTICITQLDNIKVQFELGRLQNASFKGAPAFSAAMPDAVLRLQRREYFRLTAPVSHSLRCSIPLPTVEGGERWYDARVMDISGGGIAVVAPPAGVHFHPDMEIQNCRLEIPDTAPIIATLQVRNLFRVTLRNGTEVLRAGCQFVNLTTATTNAIHRYILSVERERAARTKG